MRRLPSVFLSMLALAWAGCLAIYVFVLVVDPYELRWAKGERLADRPYPQVVVPRLAPAAVRSGADVVIVGASTAVGYTPEMMREAFPAARRPINLAYGAMTGQDMSLILPRLERSAGLKRVIISLDYTLMWLDRRNPGFDHRYFAPTWHDPAPEFNLSSVALAASVVRGGVLDAPGWSRARGPEWLQAPAIVVKPKLLATLEADIDHDRSAATPGPDIPCSALPGLSQVIFPTVRRLAARGVEVDLLAPPYPLIRYLLQKRGSPFSWWDAIGGFEGVMAIRRCALQMSAGLPHVYFFSFDDDLPLVGDLSNYGDFGHMRGGAPYQLILRRMAIGDGLVRPGGWPAVEARLRAELAAYAPPVNLAASHPLPPGDPSGPFHTPIAGAPR